MSTRTADSGPTCSNGAMGGFAPFSPLMQLHYKGNSFAIVDLLAGRIDLLLAAAGVAGTSKAVN